MIRESPEKESIIRQILSHPCPACGHVRTLCEWPECLGEAEFEAWFGTGLMRRMNVCKEHVKESRAYKEHGEKAFMDAKKE